MTFDFKEIFHARLGDNYELHEKHLNRTLVAVQRIIGFDKVYARAQGSYLYDMDGKEYLDFLSGYGVYNIGRNHPTVKKALEDALELDMPNMVQMDCALMSGLLAEALLKKTGPNLDAVFFCNSGTESVEGAIKFARAATGRDGILSLAGAYHGLTYGALSVTNIGNFREGFGSFLQGAEPVQFDDLADLETKLQTRQHAAFILELVQGKGVKEASAGYYQRAQELCHKYGTLFVCDEVQTGIGRTGEMFAFRHWNLDPDIITVAKGLSAGYVPVAAVVARRSIYQKVFSRLDRCVVHSTTFGRNNLAMVCGLATLHVMDEEKICENAARQGMLLIEGLKKLQDKHDIIKEVRGKGLMIAIEFHQPGALGLKLAWKTLQAADKGLFTQMIVSTLLKDHRILSQVAGHHMDVLKILPPLVIGQKEIDHFVGSLDQVLHDIRKFPGPIWSFGTNLVTKSLANRKQTASV